MKNIINMIKDYLMLYPYSYIFKSNKYFEFNGEKHKYFLGAYNKAWLNERTIEIPIILSLMKGYKKDQILEVGNVLSHYFPVEWDVVDKFEKGSGIISHDLVDFQSPYKYDLIISISTLEHIGFDDGTLSVYPIFQYPPAHPGSLLLNLSSPFFLVPTVILSIARVTHLRQNQSH
ncbi:hypothetical protein LCGC14_2752170, partial [marine sediment metagenome]